MWVCVNVLAAVFKHSAAGVLANNTTGSAFIYAFMALNSFQEVKLEPGANEANGTFRQINNPKSTNECGKADKRPLLNQWAPLKQLETVANGTHIYWPPVPLPLLSQCAIYSHLNRSTARLITSHLRITKRAEVRREQMVPQESPWAHRDPSWLPRHVLLITSKWLQLKRTKERKSLRFHIQ